MVIVTQSPLNALMSLGYGNYNPRSLVIYMIGAYVPDCRMFFLVQPQEILDDVTDIDLVVNLKLREDVLLEKCLGRRLCNQCGKNFNVASINVKAENGSPGMSMAPLLPPPHCASKLITRSDDTEDVVKERLRIYNEKVQFFLYILWGFLEFVGMTFKTLFGLGIIKYKV